MDNETAKFLQNEYEQCWDYIKFHYEQRDRSQRFYFTFVLASGGLIVALAQEEGELPSLRYLLPLVCALVLVGVLALGQLIQLRTTTTLYHKTIVTIRAQLIGSGKTLLWTSDENPRFYARGFNLFTALIMILLTSAISAFGAFIAISEYYPSASQLIVIVPLAVGVLGVAAQFYWYRTKLKNEDRRHTLRALARDEQSSNHTG